MEREIIMCEIGELEAEVRSLESEINILWLVVRISAERSELFSRIDVVQDLLSATNTEILLLYRLARLPEEGVEE